MRLFSPAPGGTIGVFAPSSPFDPERFQQGCAILERMGHPVLVHPKAHARTGFLAGPDKGRAEMLHELAADPRVSILMAARGGYGMHRILDRLDMDALIAANKPIVGFSDLTALHLQLHAKGAISVHGPVITQLPDLAPAELERLEQIVCGRVSGQTYKASLPAIRGGRAEGPLIGGCLSVIVPLIGTPYLPKLDGAILMLEDVGEVSYRIDRMLTHLLLSGALSRVAGVAVGEMVKCPPAREGEQSTEEVLAERLSGLGVPVLAGLPFGHGALNAALPHGAPALLDADRGVLQILELA